MDNSIQVVVRCPRCGKRIGFKPVPNYRSKNMSCPKCQYRDLAGNFLSENEPPKRPDITNSTVIPQVKKVKLMCLDTGESYVLSTGNNTIGRKVSEPRAKIMFNDPDRFMGRLHASIVIARTPQGVQIQLKDENSANGTFVNNIRINSGSIVKLLPETEIRFGKLRFKCVIESGSSDPMGPLRPGTLPDDRTKLH